MYLVRTDSGRSHYGSKYPRQFTAGILLVESRQFAARILLVAKHSSSDQNALDFSAELAEKFDNNFFCIQNDRLDGFIEPKHCIVVHFFQFSVDQINWIAYNYPLLSRKF